jgi:adenylate kinase family enzyme
MTSFTRDLKRLQSRAFHRADWAEDALRRYHLLAKESTQPVQSLYEWMFVPPTL